MIIKNKEETYKEENMFPLLMTFLTLTKVNGTLEVALTIKYNIFCGTIKITKYKHQGKKTFCL